MRVFGGLTEHVGGRHLEVPVPDDGSASVADLRAAVAAAHPRLAPLLRQVTVAVDLEVARSDDRIPAGSEVALLPPVAGGATGGTSFEQAAVRTGLVTPPIDVAGTIAAIADDAAGATALFLGTVRDHAPGLGGVVQLQYTAYEAMAERELEAIAEEVRTGYPAVTGIALLHALGDLPVGAHTVLIACTSAHRATAFDACRTALEAVKDRVPVFKREVTTDGTARWVGLEPPTEDVTLPHPLHRHEEDA
ncbi:MAG: molybdenum cofactor biosynthesis protein MoaE [Nitriliruptoraceae bacterium]